MEFSLLYFANHDSFSPAAHRELLLESARFADRHGFAALWVPERHFHRFGGAYPNPALAAAALAMATSRIRLRAGSVVLPLHDPLRVVEDWSFVDSLSGGRVDLAFGTGWKANDFVLAPQRYADRRSYLLETLPLVQDLWAGKTVSRPNGFGEQIEVATFPRPVQSLPGLWLTASSGVATFETAGCLGLNVLTALLFQSIDELAAKIGRYRAARAEHGHDPATGRVTVMVHTFVAESDEAARVEVQAPFIDYLRSSVDLWKNEWGELAGAKEERLLDFAFMRYFRTAAMFGGVDRCEEFAHQLAEAGTDEIACLVDFGVEHASTLRALSGLDEVRRRMQGVTNSSRIESL